MSLNHCQQRQLYRIEARLFRSDPHLAAMLAMFGRLSAGQRMPSWEQIATRPDRIRQAAALMITNAVAVVAAATGLLVTAVLTLLTVIFVGHRARRPKSDGQQTGPETDGRPDPASWS
jgi:predicted PurR-regulated permease PerM